MISDRSPAQPESEPAPPESKKKKKKQKNILPTVSAETIVIQTTVVDGETGTVFPVTQVHQCEEAGEKLEEQRSGKTIEKPDEKHSQFKVWVDTIQSLVQTVVHTVTTTFMTFPLFKRQVKAILIEADGATNPKVAGAWNKGLGFALKANTARNLLFFFSMPPIQRYMNEAFPNYDMTFFAFSVSSVVDGLLSAPIDYARQQLAVTENKTVSEMLRSTSNATIRRALMRGALGGGAQNAVFAPIFGLATTYGKHQIANAHDSAAYAAFKSTILFATVASLTSMLTYPIVWGKRHLMHDPYESVYNLVRRTYKLEGPKGFYKGFSNVPPALSITYGLLGLTFFAGEKAAHFLHTNPHYIENLRNMHKRDLEKGPEDEPGIFHPFNCH